MSTITGETDKFPTSFTLYVLSMGVVVLYMLLLSPRARGRVLGAIIQRVLRWNSDMREVEFSIGESMGEARFSLTPAFLWS